MAVDILCVGVVVADAVGLTIDSFPEEGSLMVFDRVEMHLGGCPANTAVGLARLGIRAGVAAKVGKDGLGDFIRNTLSENGVDVSGVKVDSRVVTFLLVHHGSQRRQSPHLPYLWRQRHVFARRRRLSHFQRPPVGCVRLPLPDAKALREEPSRAAEGRSPSGREDRG